VSDGGRPADRSAVLLADLIGRLRAFVAEHGVTYDDYRAAKQWLIDVGEAGEWPLFLDVFVESAVEEQAYAARPGSPGAIEGPYYLPDAAMLEPPYALPARPDEAGEPVVLRGRVTSDDGTPLAGALLDVWQADAEGRYSGFDAAVPDGNLRGRLRADADGRYELRTVRPAPYTIPHDGPTGRFIAAAGLHPWRPAHIHLKVSADGHELLTTQLTFADSEWVDDDVARAVKEPLIVHPRRRGGELEIAHDFVLGRLGSDAAPSPPPAVAPAPAAVPGAAEPAAPAFATARRAWSPPIAGGRAPRFGAPRPGRDGR
jgi:catechol 1,2-dioxygenase